MSGRVLQSWLVFLSLSVLAGCMVNPVTGRQELSLISPQQEVAIGKQQYLAGQQSQGGLYYIDPAVQGYVAEVGHKLARVSDRPDLPYEFVVLNNSVPNAWALPGGKIAINRGLLTHLEDESQLAAVLAHEIVHAAARHGATQMTRGMLAGIGLQALGTATNNNPLGGMVGQLGTSAWMSRYGRSAELESDAYGMDYMVRAGYDPQGAVAVQAKFVELSQGRQQGALEALFASHPPSQERVEANRAKAAHYPPGGISNAERYKRMTAAIRRDQRAYEAQAKAMQALQEKAPSRAMPLLDESIRLQPAEGQFWELRGHAWVMQGKPGNATQDYSTAVQKNPDFFSHVLARGIHYFEQRNYSSAERDLLRSRELLPTAHSSLYLGDILAARGERQQAAVYYQEAAAAPGELGLKARERLQDLQSQGAAR